MRFSTIFFDLDDTLYPASSGLWPTLKERMTRYMIERMGIPAGEVPALRAQYFRDYGTTLRGLQARHTIDVEDYLHFVHDVNLADYLHPDPVQQSVLAALPLRRLIFTNADANHAGRVLRVLGIEDLFEDIVDVNRMDPYCKPAPETFALAMQVAGETNPAKCVMIDDQPRTTRAAKDLGMFALLFGASAPQDEGDADALLNDWRNLPELLDSGRA